MATAESRPLRVVLTNTHLADRAGTELYVTEIAHALLRRGHEPVVYSTDLGPVADELRRATVPVVDNLADLNVVPDILHGQHTIETFTALVRFPKTPAVYVCHDYAAWQDTPAAHPRIRRFVAVDDTVRDRIRYSAGIDPRRVVVIPNGVDLARFASRAEPPPGKPRRALIFSNYATPSHPYVIALRAACEAAGLTLDIAGGGVGRTLDRPEELLRGYDVVFAKARSAMEAMAVGAAVILCDAGGLGPLVTRPDVAQLRRLNFGRRALCDPVDEELVAAQLRRYDAADAAAVSAWVRENAGIESVVDELVHLYREVLDEDVPNEPDAEGRAMAAALQPVTRRIKHALSLDHALASARGENEALRAQLDDALATARGESEALRAQLDQVRADAAAEAAREHAVASAERDRLLRVIEEQEAALETFRRSTAIRVATRLARLRGLGVVRQWLRGRVTSG